MLNIWRPIPASGWRMHLLLADCENAASSPLTAGMSDVATYTVRAEFEGEIHSFPCRADQTVLNAAEAAGITLPSSCCSGVCTTCAAVISEGSVEQPDAMGVKGELQQQGYSLLCVAFPRADLTLKAGQEDALYEAQFGQYQK